MAHFARRALDQLIVLREGESRSVALMFAYSFLAMTSYNILKPITRSKFITSFGAHNLPWVMLAAGLLIGVLMHQYAHAIRRLPRRAVVPVTLGGIVVLQLAFWALLQTGSEAASAGLYLFGQILGILLISQFWTLANDVYDARQAKRVFGFIGGGASLGGALGAGLTALLVDEIGSVNLLLVSAATLTCCAGIVVLILRRHEVSAQSLLEDERGVGGAEALRMLARSPHLRVIALVIGLAAGGAAIVEQQVNMVAEATGASEDGITAFLANITMYLSLAGFVVQVGLTSRIHRSLGLAFALLLLPVTPGILGGDRAAHRRRVGAADRPRARFDAALHRGQDHAGNPVPAAAGRHQVPRQAVHRRDDGSVREGARGDRAPGPGAALGPRPRLARAELREPGPDRRSGSAARWSRGASTCRRSAAASAPG